jgi:hypothetical protein
MWYLPANFPARLDGGIMNKKIAEVLIVCTCAVALLGWAMSPRVHAASQDEKKPTSSKAGTPAKAPAPQAFIGTPDKVQWKHFMSGVEFAQIYGDCDKAGAPCIFELKFADGAKIAPHWHPVDEHVTVISGTFIGGMGDNYDESKAAVTPAGTYIFMPRHMHHFAGAKGETVVQVQGVGPFKTFWVNPADDPGKAAKSTK